jgi:hypothetical protein
MVDSAMEPDLINRYFISMSGHLLLAIASFDFSLLRLIGSHSAITACIINDTFLHTLNELHLVVEVRFEFPALGQPRKLTR